MAPVDGTVAGVRSLVPGSVRAGVSWLCGRPVVLAKTVPTERRGALGRSDGETLARAAELALQLRLPLVLELATSGADVSEGLDALHGWGTAAAAVARCSGVVPVVAAVTGPVISGPALLLGMADLVVMDPGSTAFVSGPSMVASFTGRPVTIHQLGGHGCTLLSGLSCVESDDPLGTAGDLLAYLPANCDEEAPLGPLTDPVDREVPSLRRLVPTESRSAYDVREVMSAFADHGVVAEVRGRWAPQLVTALARIGGHPVGLVGNQPQSLAGTLDIAASQKGARFVRFCDAFNLPIVTLVDTPGFLPGKDLEWRGMIRHGAEFAFAYGEATVPRVCLILRKAYGGAYIVMDSKGLGNDVCLAWPGAEVAVMGSRGAVQVLHRGRHPDERQDLERSYEADFLSPWPAAARGLVDEVIDPAMTRSAIASSLAVLATRREALSGRKHDAGPL